jgi:hypothetical protein
MFVYSGISPTGILITGGTAETCDGPICSVPKLTLVSRLQALLHEGRLKILRELVESETFVGELQDFRIEFTAAGHLTFRQARRSCSRARHRGVAGLRRRRRELGVPRSDALADDGLDAELFHRR